MFCRDARKRARGTPKTRVYALVARRSSNIKEEMKTSRDKPGQKINKIRE
jgi:hypothetical protein